ncbi:MAG: phosphoglucosamine mutase [Bryobacterales bacterium]|nr:phosphoglucosamine mutase [Bryobacterales bacterium]
MSRAHQLKIGVSGIRGVVGEFLTPSLAASFAQAFGTYVGPGRVVLGRDTRSTGEMLEHAVACGLLAAGCEVVKVGILPTPTIQVYVAATGARGGLAVTASHNPPEYNALKLFNGEGLFFNHYERSELLELYHQSQFQHATNSEIRFVREDYASAPQRHFELVLKHVDAEAIRRRRFKVALDGVNGAGSLMSVRFLRDVLGCELHAISVDPTKPFPREAEPRPEVLGDLAALVRDNGCAIGFAQDPDGDRLAVADETGRVLDNDDVLAMAVDCVLGRSPGPVVVNLTTSSVIDDVAARHKCPVYRAPVGEANVVDRMQAVKAVIGGEGSNGGIIFPGVQYCRDSYTGMAFLLDRLAATGMTTSQLHAQLPRYYRSMGKKPFAHGHLGVIMQGLQQKFPEALADRTDGLKLLFPDSWIHVRASNTEPILRYAVEAKSEARLNDLVDKVNRLL